MAMAARRVDGWGSLERSHFAGRSSRVRSLLLHRELVPGLRGLLWNLDPDLNAWYDTSGNENGDRCAWKWGPVTGSLGGGAYNTVVARHHWLIQMNGENARGGGCDQKLGGRFYGQ
jgi:hypothetical protein